MYASEQSACKIRPSLAGELLPAQDTDGNEAHDEDEDGTDL